MSLAVEVSGLVAVFALLVGAWGVLAPSRVADFAIRLSTMAGLWVAAGIRVVFGLALWCAAAVAVRATILWALLPVAT